MFKEFKAFVNQGNALDLAVGVIIGAAFGKIVNSLVNDIIMPPIGKVLGNVDFSAMVVDLGDGVQIRYGSFINAVIAFIVIAFVVWQIGKMVIKEEPPAEVKTCTYCKEANAVDATKCRACTSAI